MAIRDDDFVENQIELAAKGLAKVIDMDVLEKLLSKENIDRVKDYDDQKEKE